MSEPTVSPISVAASGAEGAPEKGVAQDPSLVELLSSLHRLLKVARMYDGTNQALTTGAEAVLAATVAFCDAESVPSADLIFANETVFVNGVMLHMTRDVYARVVELGAFLDRSGISNVNIASTATAQNLIAFVQWVGKVLRDTSLSSGLAKADFGGVRARRLRWRANLESEEAVVSRTVRTYASAVVLIRRYYADFASGKSAMPSAMRRLAQRIVTHSEQESPLLVALATTRGSAMDEATIAVNSAFVAVLMARQITRDRGALANLTLVMLLHDLGRRRLLAARGGDAVLGTVERRLSDEEQDRVAASGALAMASLDRMGDVTLPQTFLAFEAHWLRHTARAGAVYRGRRPASVLGRIIYVARSFSELMAPGAYAATMGPEDAIEFLVSRAADETERLYVKLLTGGLGIFPPGTTVELSTGEIGVVVRVPPRSVDFARPPIRVMYDAAGNFLEQALDVDLSAPVPLGGTLRSIRRTIDSDAQQSQAMRSFVLSITRGDTSRRQVPTMPEPELQSGKRPVPTSLHAAEETLARPPPPQERTSPEAPPAEVRVSPKAPDVRQRTEPGAPPSQVRTEPAVTAVREPTNPGSLAPRDRTNPGSLVGRDRTGPPRELIRREEPSSRDDLQAPASATPDRVRTRPPVEIERPSADPRAEGSAPKAIVAPRVRTLPPLETRAPGVDPRAEGDAPKTVVAPRVRTLPPLEARAPGVDPRAEGDAAKAVIAPRVRTLPPLETRAPGIDPRAEGGPTPSVRARTRPPGETRAPFIDPRSEDAVPSSALPPRVRSRPPLETRASFVDPRSEDADDSQARISVTTASRRPITAPGPSSASPQPPASRAGTNPPISRTEDAPPIPPAAPSSRDSLARADARPPADPAAPRSKANDAATVARSWSSFEQDSDGRAPEPPARPIPAGRKVNEAATVARNWSSFDPNAVSKEPEPAPAPSARKVNEAATVARNWSSFDPNAVSKEPEPAPAPSARKVNEAATVARNWSSFEPNAASREPEPAPAPSARKVNEAATVARNWSSFDPNAASKDPEPAPAASARKVNEAATVARNWSSFDPNAASKEPAPAPAAKKVNEAATVARSWATFEPDAGSEESEAPKAQAGARPTRRLRTDQIDELKGGKDPRKK